MLHLLSGASAPRSIVRAPAPALGKLALSMMVSLALSTLPAASAAPSVTRPAPMPSQALPVAGPVVSPTPTPSPGALLPPPANPVAESALDRPRDDVSTQVRIERCQSRSPRVWLTFDDGGSPQQVHRILRVLRVAHVRAIFFPIGSWAEANPALIRSIGRAGHIIGNHTHDHVDLAKASATKARWQIRHGAAHAVGSVPLLRPPFGAGAYTTRLHVIAEQTGVRLCTWTVDTRDWTGSAAATIVRRVRRGDAMTPPVKAGGVVIMHMNGDHTGKALPGVIRAVRARGLSLHRLSSR